MTEIDKYNHTNTKTIGVDEIKLVIFDCDGVIVDSEPLSSKALVEVLVPYQTDINDSYVYEQLVGKEFRSVKKQIEYDFSISLPLDFEIIYREHLKILFELELEATKGIHKVLRELTCRHCLATSSSPKRVSYTLNKVGFADRFEKKVFTASQVEHGKPAPDLFLFAAEQMEVDPKNCLVIEDSVPGVQAAISANMQVLRYTGGGHLIHQSTPCAKLPSDIIMFSDWSKLFTLLPILSTGR